MNALRVLAGLATVVAVAPVPALLVVAYRTHEARVRDRNARRGQ